MKTRGSGVLLHITSLPSRFGIGDLGPSAYDFVQFLSDAGQRYWQILPIHPTDPDYDNSPYHALS
ncbi:MAG: 4-alpha-glucanotransferase, partial [Methanomicrobiales archaeon HGW-Methanomicrobiales-4]